MLLWIARTLVLRRFGGPRGLQGQPRMMPDIGADELSPAPALRRPLTTADVGPDAP